MTIETLKLTLDEVLPAWREFSLSNETRAMEIAIRALAVRAGTYKPGFKNRKFVAGTRVLVKHTAGFHKGARGIVQYSAPDGNIWVLRYGASEAVWYKADELKFDEEVSPDHQCITLENGDCINPYCNLHSPAKP